MRFNIIKSSDVYLQVKQSLTEAVNMNEQQLQMTEQKDQEFVKLKLEIQQTIVDKDKTIKEQKQKLKSNWMKFLIMSP